MFKLENMFHKQYIQIVKTIVLMMFLILFYSLQKGSVFDGDNCTY